MYTVYILKSQSCNRYYIGHTQNLEQRLIRHNSEKVTSTKNFCPWEIIYTESFKTKSDAQKREYQIKKYKGGEAFKKLVA